MNKYKCKECGNEYYFDYNHDKKEMFCCVCIARNKYVCVDK